MTTSTTGQGAASFSPTNDVIRVADHNDFDFTGSFTLEAWVNISHHRGAEHEGTIVGKEGSSSNSGYVLRTGNNGDLRFVIFNNGGNGIFVPGALPNTNQWYHVAGVYDATSQVSRLYVDGVEVGSKTNVPLPAANSQYLGIGNLEWYPDRGFDGFIDEVRVWNVARTAGEIDAFRSRSLCTGVNGLVAHYPMNNSTVNDATGNGHNGTLQNGATLVSGGQTLTDLPSKIYVDQAAAGNNDGTSWIDAFTDLQDALDFACTGTEIWVAQGTYHPTHSPDGSTANNRDKAFHFNTDMKIYGGFNGTEGLLSQRDATANATILSGDFNNNDVVTGGGSTLSITNNTENAYHVLITASLTTAAVMDGFTIEGGNADVGGSITYSTKTYNKSIAGGMYNNSSSPTLTNVAFSNNNGGGMYNVSFSSPTLTNVAFSNNNGSGIANTSSSSPTITNAIFSSNRASYGGGMHNSYSSIPTITNASFSSNSATISGGGMYNSNSSSPSLTNVTFINNSANSGGGGMYNQVDGTFNNQSSSPSLYNTVFYGNMSNGSTSDIDVEGALSNINASSSHNASDGTGGNITAGTGFVALTADPFVNSSDPNGTDDVWMTDDDGLMLAYGSSLAGAGTATGAPSQDITGAARPNPPSIGAYEEESSLCHLATLLYVNQAATGNDTGESWANAFTNLQDALNCADEGESIWVAEGTYFPTQSPDGTSTDNRDKAFHFNANVKVYGGFMGTETSLAERDIAAYPTILSGDLGTPNDNSDNAYHVVIANFGITSATTLDGFTIEGGNANGVGSSQNIIRNYGGGIYNYRSGIILNNIILSHNSASYAGGGMYNFERLDAWQPVYPTLTNVTISDNTAAYYGGGLYSDGMSGLYTTVSFQNNTATVGGGGMYTTGDRAPLIDDATFSYNSAEDGGGFYQGSGTGASLTDVTFLGNSATNDGGGIYNANGGGWFTSLILTNPEFNSNTAGNRGGGIHNEGGSNIIEKGLFNSNLATNEGGGMSNSGGFFSGGSEAWLSDVIFYNNSAANGGGVANTGCIFRVTDGVFGQNTSTVKETEQYTIREIHQLILRILHLVPTPPMLVVGCIMNRRGHISSLIALSTKIPIQISAVTI
ncbi:MAG: LamG-like jellyroll fold domain-containing protein [Saprospiraceae bacterium]